MEQSMGRSRPRPAEPSLDVTGVRVGESQWPGEPNNEPEPAHHVICTLAEQHYFNGMAALANSLVQAGFAGIIVVGYRGATPHWLDTLKPGPAQDLYDVTPSVRLHMVEVDGEWHLNNCKPRFIEDVLFTLHPEADVVYYFDTDMVITHPWTAFVRWTHVGVVMVLDVADTYMSPHHIYRHGWRALAARQNRPCRDFTGYVNGGCVGISRSNAAFAHVWSRLMEELERDGADMAKMKNNTGKLEFARMDQDILNATIMATEVPVALLGPEAMGMFPWTGTVMPHAMWQRKPWERNYIVDALRGFPPGRVNLAYWKFVDGPIRPFSRVKLAMKRFCLLVGHAIGLLHTRSFRDV